VGIVGRHMFEPIAVEILGVFNASAVRLLNDLGRRISSISGDTEERLVICISEFRCWCSVSMLFCYTTACRSLTALTEHHTLSVIFINFKPPSGIDSEGFKNNNNNIQILTAVECSGAINCTVVT